MTYLHLLSPEGEPFEVVESRAGALLTNGWSFNDRPLKDTISRLESTETVTAEGAVDPVEPQGAVADAEVFAEDIPVEVEQAPTEAGPAPEPQEANVIDGDASKRVEETGDYILPADRDEAEEPRKNRRKQFTSDV